MKLQIICIRDIIANCYPFPPMFVAHLGGAVRDFGDQCRDKTTQLGKHPDDYELYHVGEWDDTDAHFNVDHRAIQHGDTIFERKQIAVGSNYNYKE